MRPAAKTCRVQVRVSPKQKRLIEHAAALEGMSVSEFMVKALERAAPRAIEIGDLLERNEQFVRALTDKELKWMCTCVGGPCSAEEHALRHARYDEQGNRLKNPDGSWFWGT